MTPGLSGCHARTGGRFVSLALAVLAAAGSIGAQGGIEIDGSRVTRLPGAGETGTAQGARAGAGGPESIGALRQAATRARAHPLVSTGGGPARPDRVLAHAKDRRAVTAGELFLHLCLAPEHGRAEAVVEMDEAIDPEDRKAAAREVDASLAFYAATHLAPAPDGDPLASTPRAKELIRKAVSVRLGHYAYLDSALRQAASVSEADRLKFRRERGAGVTEPFQLAVRYIKKSAAPMETVRGGGHATDAPAAGPEATLNAIRAEILQGRTTFAAAARAHSDAPSRAKGGEIPPFRPGELFSLFEENALKLEPGGISPVFPGPGGFYLVQLIRRLDARPHEKSKDLLPRERALAALDRELDRRAWANAYEMDWRTVQDRTPIVDHILEYAERRADERLGQAGNFRISRADFEMLHPLDPRTGLIPGLERRSELLNGLLVAAAFEQLARHSRQASAPSAAATAMADRVARRIALERAMMDQALPLPPEEELRRFHARNAPLFTPVAPKRLVRLEMRITDTAMTDPPRAAAELRRVLGQLNSGRSLQPDAGPMPSDREFFLPPGVVEDRALLGALRLEEARPEEIAAALGRSAIPAITTETLEMLQRQLDTPISTETVRALVPDGESSARNRSGFSIRPIPSDVPAAPTPAPAQDDSATTPAQGGGFPPSPASGGLPPADDSLPDFAARQPDRKLRPAKPLDMAARARNYSSPLYSLSIQDRGWVVLEDQPALPEEAMGLGAGASTPVRVTRNGAEAWHVAETLPVAPRPFEDVRSQVEAAYVAAQFRRLRAADLRRAVSRSGVGKVADPKFPTGRAAAISATQPSRLGKPARQ